MPFAFFGAFPPLLRVVLPSGALLALDRSLIEVEEEALVLQAPGEAVALEYEGDMRPGRRVDRSGMLRRFAPPGLALARSLRRLALRHFDPRGRCRSTFAGFAARALAKRAESFSTAACDASSVACA